MGFLSRFEGKMEDTFEGAADRMANAPISPVQIAKKAEKQMKREKMVGAGKQYAPTLYTVLVNPDDDQRLFGYYPTLAGETETYLAAKASEQGLVMDGQPLVRFIVDEGLKHGKFDVIAEAVAAPIIAQLRDEEMQRYGLASPRSAAYGAPAPGRPMGGAYPQQQYVPPAPAPAPAYGGYDQPYDQGYDQGYDGYAQAPAAGYQSYDAYGQPAAAPASPAPTPAPAPTPGYAPEANDYLSGYDTILDEQGFEEPLYAPRASAVDPYELNAEHGVAPVASAAPAVDIFPAAGAAAAGAAAAGAAAAGAAMGAGMAAAPEPARAVAADTVVFAGGAQAATPVPAQAAVRARLIDTTNNRAYDLATSRLLIGRESKNDIAVQDINASRVHAELRREPQGTWVLSDLGSTNGTFVNGREISSQPLAEGDRITIGVTDFVFTQA